MITRPRRFGKTLNMSMLDRFWNIKYQGQGELFQNLDIWKEEKYRELQGTYPVISLSFANVKEDNYDDVKDQIFQIITDLYSHNEFLKDSGKLGDKDKEYFDRIGPKMNNSDASMALNKLSDYLYRYYGKKVIILLDEYNTPMQEAYVKGYWEELVYNPRKEVDLEATVQAALAQIEEKKYEQTLLDHGVKQENIRKYGFAFEGKKVLIG